MKYLSIEEIWKKYPNKYQALDIAALEARHIIDGLQKGEIQLTRNIYEYALEKLVHGEIKYERLTDAEMKALTRESYNESYFGRVR
ncbi:hypothetical protein CH330_01065 [candidate division WOR-3 bacterium JGI_Cruoil_03_51_56]|uniref:DNA-directed RNA polymerase n=1 Tax=candidate division WOR-3 bacterium JGI_Cruoil_03_51_56 TaxID=1973747 RepID=A0A235BXF5_UNCW3|nr:MAG: hypothetical protein CH330_01065 [candidate division WOR-3 bacterium JGI_Cruoil_03_51_56]